MANGYMMVMLSNMQIHAAHAPTSSKVLSADLLFNHLSSFTTHVRVSVIHTTMRGVGGSVEATPVPDKTRYSNTQRSTLYSFHCLADILFFLGDVGEPHHCGLSEAHLKSGNPSSH